ncbi:lysophospholipid acyltransferase family protein [Singulisphaera acidiphila]|uniref:Lauroyl/myristoyl acyltransferase n=1 Tax=Singulisphaera acidiphila (strain ATCC BAA-1392 / DSM 18658 / VKM B-2454 / MOB10) TaxID=886293 RepID=L0DE27_SINAD|nr:lysophospholipid acyltransferase family protein [Singulisphaera acidiphila]AGA27120.1 Lauroyl/myristoyl acyltransferase [Singulisphaera acidiphila DSM 18658]
MWQRWMIVHKVVLQVVLPVLRRLPYRLSIRLLGIMGRLDLLVIPHQTRLYEEAVAGAAERLGCDWNVRAVSRALARQTYRWRTRDLLLDGRSDRWIDPLFQVSGRDKLEAAQARGKGVILLANHFGSHVLMTHWLFRQGFPLRWFGEKPRNISEYLIDKFQSEGTHGQAGLFVSRKAGTAEGASTIYHAARILNAGLIVKIACDVRWNDAKAVSASFLGRTESFSTTWVTLAAMTGAAVVPAFCRMDEQGTFHLDFRDPLIVPPDARRPGRAIEWVDRALDTLEEQVRLFPEQSNDYFFWEAVEEQAKNPAPSRRSERAVAVR